ncbi:MAG: fructose-bisphosphate aldolase class I [Actinobacteria bacterium]|nr:fructose-bisphosphate aldolase class I [Actinomycetota bacterium]MBW3642724.1 fructose-bisphosphate aldolase class I [Actinomycetota bacterium]
MADDLTTNAQALVAPGRGVLAADESTGTIGKRFASIDIESTAETRQAYRDTLFTTPGLADSISGVIMYDETIRQSSADGTPFPDLLKKLGIQPGIKVDTGAKDLAKAPGEKITEGLDGLRERIAEYVDLGATFAKWRAVITIGEGGLPSRYCIEANAHALARYAALCQEGGLVPIVEPEVLMDGDHSIERCFEVTELTQRTVFSTLAEHRVDLEQMVLKPNMVISGKGNAQQAGVEEVAEQTLRCLRRTVPPAVPGIAFLSGGQSAAVATEHLNAMNTMGPHPWVLTFSYGRALQDPALAAWKGEASNREASQQALSERARANSEATSGSYKAA